MPSRFDHALEALEDAVRRSSGFRAWLRSRRWCGEAVGLRSELAIRDAARLGESGTEALVLFLAFAKEGPSTALLHLPLSLALTRLDPDAFELLAGQQRFFVIEAERRESYAHFLEEGFRKSPKLRTRAGDRLQFAGEPLGAFRSFTPSPTADSSNLLVRMATSEGEVLFKSYKLLDPQNRESVILERLRRRHFPHVPRFLGTVALGQGAERLVLGLATERVDGEDLFTHMTSTWREALSPAPASEVEEDLRDLASGLGEATALLHEALIDRKPGPFQAEPFTGEDAQAAYRTATGNLADSIRLLASHARPEESLPPEIASESRGLLLDHRRDIEDVLAFLEASIGTVKSVTHGDLHLGQVLRSARDRALFFVDFEGEPDRPAGQRSLKLPPLRDVATMNRSFAYVRHNVWRSYLGGGPSATWKAMRPDGLSQEEAEILRRLEAWEGAAVDGFSRRYLERTGLYPELEPDTARRVLRGWMMEKALYELRYELKHRPGNAPIPLEGILSLAGVGS